MPVDLIVTHLALLTHGILLIHWCKVLGNCVVPEQEKSYVTVCKTTELPPGERLVIELRRKWVVIFNVDGTYYALEDMCTHEEVPLSEGTLDGYSIECHQHGACFDIRTGAVLAPPAFIAVKRFDVRVEGDDVQIETR